MKKKRQALILDIIQKNAVETQEELQELLKSYGTEVTQATISRDIRELRLIKSAEFSGKSIYIVRSSERFQESDKMSNILVHGYRSVDYANNLVVLKTTPGMGQAVAAVIDERDREGVLGTIAGDDTLMIVCRDENIAKELTVQIKEMTEKRS